MKQRFTKRMRLVSGLLTAAMVFTFLPFSALADSGIDGLGSRKILPHNFPDATFMEYVKQFDTHPVGNPDGFLDADEREAVTEIDVHGKNISNLYGIQFFPNLEKLDCDQNNLSSLDVSQNPALKYLYCEQNNLSSLDVSSNSALKYLHCTQNNLSSLDVSQNPALEYLLCAQNKLTSLDVSKNEALKLLNCKNNQLTNLNVEYTNIDPSVFLSELLAQDNTYPITVGSDRTFNLSTLPGKFEVSKAGNWVGGTVSGNTLKVKEGATQVTYTYDCGKGLSETFTLNVTVGIRIFGDNFPNYEFRQYLKANIDKDGDGYLNDTELNIKKLDVSGQYIANLKGIEFFSNLETLYCYNNKLTSLDVSKNPELKSLWCYNNQLTSLDVSQNAELVELYCEQNNLTSLDVSQNTALLKLTCQDNNLTSLDLTQNTGLEYLSCSRNPLGSLDVSKNINLKTLYCEQSNLTSLDLSQNHKLEMLYAKKNRLVSLDLSQTAVTTLYADDNQIDIYVEETSRTFDLSTLPGKFDVSKVTNWNGGTVDGNTLKVDEGATQVTYTYDCGKGLSRDFTLNVNVVPDSTVTPPSGGDGTGTTTPPSGGDGTGTTTPPSGGGGGGAGLAVLAVGGTALVGLAGYGIYSYVTEQQLKAILPEGTAVPENRAQTALLLWNTAGRPEPAAAPAFADVADPDTAKAAQWCVEQNLLQTRRDGAFAPDSTLPAYKTLNAYRQLTGK